MRKYTPGQRITSVDELMAQDMIYFVSGGYRKPYHKGWFLSWPLRTVQDYLARGVLYAAEEKGEANETYRR